MGSEPKSEGSTAARMWSVVLAQLTIDRTRLVPAARTSLLLHVLAWATIVTLFLVGWGDATVAAFRVLLGEPFTPPAYSPGTIGHQLGNLARPVAVTIAAILVLTLFRRVPAPAAPFPAVRPATWVKTFFVAPIGSAIGFNLLAVVSALGVSTMMFPHPKIDGGIPFALYVLDLAMAGPSEELALLAVVVTVLRRAGYSWLTVGLVAVAVRIPFHMYYGWGALGLSAWALLMVALYRRTGTAVPIAVAHAVFNIAGVPELSGVGFWVRGACSLTGAVVIILTFVRAYVVDSKHHASLGRRTRREEGALPVRRRRRT